MKRTITPGDLFSGPVNIKWEEGVPVSEVCSSQTAVWLNGVVYVGGGFEAGVASYNINCYDPVKNSWSSPINTPYSFFAMTTLNSKLQIVGGVDIYHKKANQVSTLDSTELRNYTKMTTARYRAIAAGHQGMLIITGGKDNEHKTLSSTELFDTNNGQWYKCDDLPQSHYLLHSVILDNILYLLGGYKRDDHSPAVFTAPLDNLSRHQIKWSTNQDTPWCCSAPVIVNNTHLLIVGGSKRIKNVFTYTSDIHKLNKNTHSWQAIGHIPSAISSSAAVSTADNRVIVIGGRNDIGKDINTVWIGSYELQ